MQAKKANEIPPLGKVTFIYKLGTKTGIQRQKNLAK